MRDVDIFPVAEQNFADMYTFFEWFSEYIFVYKLDNCALFPGAFPVVRSKTTVVFNKCM